LFLRLHDARYPVSHIGLPIIVGIGRHGPANSIMEAKRHASGLLDWNLLR
jgi:hypothetical protein